MGGGPARCAGRRKVLEVDGERYVVSLNGSSGRVCNLRARKVPRLRLDRRLEDVVATEVADPEKPRSPGPTHRGDASPDAPPPRVGGRMRYTRTWVLDAGRWRAFAAHIGPAAP